jgi:hypothetical protein
LQSADAFYFGLLNSKRTVFLLTVSIKYVRNIKKKRAKEAQFIGRALEQRLPKVS